MKNLSQIYVILNLEGKKYNVGILAEIKDKIYFEYDAKFLKTNFELSPFKLPLKSGARENKDTTFNKLFGVFNDSLLYNKDTNHLNNLLNLPLNSIGALEYQPEKKIKEQKITTSFNELELSDIVPTSHKQTLCIQVDKTKKYIYQNQSTLKDGFYSWLLKIPTTIESLYSANIEYAYSLMAKTAGLDTNLTYLFQTKEKQNYFGMKRFDRDGEKHLHTHTLAGLTHSDNDTILDYDDFLALTLTLTKNIKDLHKAFRYVCFNILAHNKSYNPKDISYIMNKKGEWSLAPAYNLTFSYGDNGKYCMKTMNERSWIKINHLVKLAKIHDIVQYEDIIENIADAISKWSSFAKIANVPYDEALTIKTILNKIYTNRPNNNPNQ